MQEIVEIYKIVLIADPGHPLGYPMIFSISRGQTAIHPDELPQRVHKFLGILKENSEVYRIKKPPEELAIRIKENKGIFAPNIKVSGGRKVINGHLTFYVRYTPPPARDLVDTLPKLDMKSANGSHWGISDWYPSVENAIVKALKGSADFTTGWYSSKKEIHSGRVSRVGRVLVIEASCSDDFDVSGYGVREIKATKDLSTIRDVLDEVMNEANTNQIENHPVEMWRIIHEGSWIETYLTPSGRGDSWIYEDEDGPPRDNYHEWGFQGQHKIPEHVKTQIVDTIQACTSEQFEVEGYQISKIL